MVVLFFLMRAIRRHYDRVALELVAAEEDAALPVAHPRDRAGVQGPPPDPARAGLRQGLPTEHPRGGHGRRRRRRHRRTCCEAWDAKGISVPLKVLASPYREITKPVLDYVRAPAAQEPARRRHGLHPGVRRRSLVGAAAAQPERPAAEGPAALHPRRHGHLGALPAALVGTCRAPARASTAVVGSVRRGPARRPASAPPVAARPTRGREAATELQAVTAVALRRARRKLARSCVPAPSQAAPIAQGDQASSGEAWYLDIKICAPGAPGERWSGTSIR